MLAPAPKSALRGSQSAAPATEICTSRFANDLPHVQKSRFTAPVTKSEHLEDHHRVQSAAPATKSALRSKTAPIPCASPEKSTLDHQIFPCTCHDKCPKMRTARQRERSRDKHPPPPPRFREPAQSKCTSRISRGMNVL